jgi:lipopolysaccharide/colanic/teichoic acid biosynthesis glycosyltransferase
MWGTVLLIGVLFCTLGLAVVHSLLTQEIRAWLPHLARRLVRGAARGLPADSRARYEAEWIAELAAWDDRAISALARAAHIRWKTKAIRESLGEARVRGERSKRMLDIAVAATVLVVVSPNLLLVAIAIKLDSRGPVFFRQPCAGRGGQRFSLIKFRSMYVDQATRWEELRDSSEHSEQPDPVFSNGDPRVTRVGRFIRLSSLDELPQLLNVVKGDMSLVGPRLRHSSESEAFHQEGDSGRTDLRPGLTGPGQINNFPHGPRSRGEEARMDEEYARQRSLLTDLLILARTVPAILHGRGG